MADFNFQSVITGLDKVGFYDIALPFLLIFTITFAILQKIKLFGANSKNFNAVIAIAMAFLVVRNSIITDIMNQFLPKISLISVIIVVTLLLLGILLNKENTSFTGFLGGAGILLTLIGVVIAFVSSTGLFGVNLPSWLNISSSDRNFLIGLFLFFGFFAYLTTDSSDKSENGLVKWLKELPNDIGGKK